MKAKITVIFEYKINPDNYEKECCTDEQRMEADLKNFRGDPELILEGNYDLKISGKVIR